MKIVSFSTSVFVLFVFFYAVPGLADISGSKNIESFLKKVIVNEIKEDYKGKGADISVEVTKLEINRVDQKRSHGHVGYFAEGKITYKTTLNSNWVNMNGESFKKGRVDHLTRRFKGGLLEGSHGVLKEDASNKISVYEETPCP